MSKRGKSIEEQRAENPGDFFPPEEADRRMREVMMRMCGKPATFDLQTGQNIGEPKLSEEELKRRGYPCDLGL